MKTFLCFQNERYNHPAILRLLNAPVGKKSKRKREVPAESVDVPDTNHNDANILIPTCSTINEVQNNKNLNLSQLNYNYYNNNYYCKQFPNKKQKLKNIAADSTIDSANTLINADSQPSIASAQGSTSPTAPCPHPAPRRVPQATISQSRLEKKSCLRDMRFV